MQDIFPFLECRVLITYTTGSVQNISQIDYIGPALWQRHALVGIFPPPNDF
jgi:hypothetical protein